MHLIDEIGGRHFLKSTCRIYENDFDLQIISTDQSITVRREFDGTISLRQLESIRKQGFIEDSNSSIFWNVELCKSIFSWDNKSEISFILRNLDTSLRLLDVGCGWGRNMIPIDSMGIPIDGFDVSPKLIQYVSNSVSKQARAFVSEFDKFQSPFAYSGAYSAMNSLRYSRNFAELKAHFHQMRFNLLPNSTYLVGLTISPDSIKPRGPKQWLFEHKGIEYMASWEFLDVDHCRREVFEMVSIKNLKNGGVYREIQKQLFLTSAALQSCINSMGFLRVQSAWDEGFNEVKSYNPLPPGTHWLSILF